MNSQYDRENILTSLNQIEKHKIIPANACQKILRQQSKFNQFDSSGIPYFPLEWFDIDADDVDYDVRYFEECRDGFAFLPVAVPPSTAHDFEWQKVNIKAYDAKSNKWHVENVENSQNYKVPRIYLTFSTENPQKFTRRIQNAAKHREKCECNLRFEMILNEFPVNRIPHPFVHLRDKIEKLLDMSETTSTTMGVELMEFYQRESCIVFQKFLIAQQLIKFINERKSNSEYLKRLEEIELPRKLHVERNFLTIECQNNNNDCLRNLRDNRKSAEKSLRQLWLYCCPQSIKIMQFIHNECESVSRMSFFHLETAEPTDWEGFHAENNSKLHSMSAFLRSEWIDTIVHEIQLQLSNVGKGWYDLSCIDSWSMYKMSKLSHLIDLIKKRMEVAVMKLLKSSLEAFVNHLCRPCECLLHISDDYEWIDDDLVNSPFHTEYFRFKVSLTIDNATKMPIYSILNLQNGRLERDILGMYDECILTSHDIPQIDPYVMKKLKFDVENLKLSSIGLLDVTVQNQILQLRESYRKCLVALSAYAVKYEKFIELKYQTVDDGMTAKEIESEIYRQTKLCEELKAEIPNDIIIGPFMVETRQLKNELIEKCMDVIKVLKENLIVTAREKISNIQHSYDGIIQRLTEKPLTIEHLDEISKWIPSIPKEVGKLSTETRLALDDFRIIESFWLALTDEMFTARWRVVQMPQIINRQINETKKQHVSDVERFIRMHSSDLTVFHERLSEISLEVSDSLQHARSDVVLSVWTKLNSLRERGELLNGRCLIFNQPEIDMELLDAHIERVYPHQNYWTMTTNFLTSKEMWTEEIPLSMLDIQSIEAEIERYNTIVEDSREHFRDDERLMMSLNGIAMEIREFKEIIDILKDITNPALNEVYIEKLTEATGIGLNNKATTLKDIILYGAPRFLIILQQLVQEAAEQADREREEKIQWEIEEEERRKREEEIRAYREVRRAARKDLFG